MSGFLQGGRRRGRVFHPFIAAIIISVDAFVHPGVTSFVRAQSGIEPVVTHFVLQQQIKIPGCGLGCDAGDRGVFHSSGRAHFYFGGAGCVVGVFADESGAEANGIFYIAGGVLPEGFGNGSVVSVYVDDPPGREL